MYRGCTPSGFGPQFVTHYSSVTDSTLTKGEEAIAIYRMVQSRHGKNGRSANRLTRRFLKEEFAPEPNEGLEVDEKNCLIRNICILGPNSRNRNRYTRQAMEQAVADGIYDNAKSFINHPEDPRGRRKFEARLGKTVNPRFENGRVYADYLYNPKHDQADSLVWAAKNDPDFGGFSPNHETVGHEEADGTWVVHKITQARSVDLVAEPATNRNLQEGAMDPELDDIEDGGGNYEEHLGKLVTAVMRDTSLDVAAKRKKILGALKLLDDEPEEEVEDGGDMVGDEEEGRDDHEDMPESPENEPEWMGKDEEEDEEQGLDVEPMAECPDCGGEMVNGECPACSGERSKVAKESTGSKQGKKRMKESIDYARQLAKSKDPRVRHIAESLLHNLDPQPPRRPAGRGKQRHVQESVRRHRQVQEDLSHHPDPRVRRLAREHQDLAERHDVMESRLDEMEVAQQLTSKRTTALRLCEKAHLPREAVTKTFLGQLLDAPSRQVMEDLVEDRRHAFGIQIPVYAQAGGPNGMTDKQAKNIILNGHAEK